MLHPMVSPDVALLIFIDDRPGVLHDLTGVILAHAANIASIEIIERHHPKATVYLELESVADGQRLVQDIADLPAISEVARVQPFSQVYGKRIIVIGGGAQVGQVAVGAISEADRHNIRGERISVDTIPLVGEEELAAAVRAVMRLPRVKALVLAGSLMGGEVSRAVHEVRARGIMVISLNMA